MHDVDGPAALAQQPLDRVGQAVHDVLELEGHGSFRVVDEGHVAPGAFLPRALETRRVAQCRAHRDHLRGPQLQERYLPRPAALTVPVEVELVHDDHVRVQRGPLAQRLIRENLGRAADDGRVGVERHVAGHHTDVVRAEQRHEVKELLRHQGLERRRVVGAATVRHRRKVRGERDHRLARPRGGRSDHVVARQDLHQGLLLVGVERTPGALGPGHEGLVQGIVVAQAALVLQVIQDLVQSRAHAPIVPECAHVCVPAPPGPSRSSSTRPGHQEREQRAMRVARRRLLGVQACGKMNGSHDNERVRPAKRARPRDSSTASPIDTPGGSCGTDSCDRKGDR